MTTATTEPKISRADWLLQSMYDACVDGAPDPTVAESLDMLALIAERMPRSGKEIAVDGEIVTNVTIHDGGYGVELTRDGAEVVLVYVGRRGAPRVGIERCTAGPADLERVLYKFFVTLVRGKSGR